MLNNLSNRSSDRYAYMPCPTPHACAHCRVCGGDVRGYAHCNRALCGCRTPVDADEIRGEAVK